MIHLSKVTIRGCGSSMSSVGSNEGATPGEALPATTRGERTRRRLLDAAEAVFAESPYHEASIVRIVERAGVAQGTFYIYFHSKLEIFEELLADLNARLRRQMATAAAGGGTRLDVERRGFLAFFGFTAEHPALYRVLREAEFIAPQAQRDHYEKIVEGYVQALGTAMADGEVESCDPTMLAWALIALGQFVGMRWIVWDHQAAIPEPVYEACMQVVRRLLGGGGRGSA